MKSQPHQTMEMTAEFFFPDIVPSTYVEQVFWTIQNDESGENVNR